MNLNVVAWKSALAPCDFDFGFGFGFRFRAGCFLNAGGVVGCRFLVYIP